MVHDFLISPWETKAAYDEHMRRETAVHVGVDGRLDKYAAVRSRSRASTSPAVTGPSTADRDTSGSSLDHMRPRHREARGGLPNPAQHTHGTLHYMTSFLLWTKTPKWRACYGVMRDGYGIVALLVP